MGGWEDGGWEDIVSGRQGTPMTHGGLSIGGVDYRPGGLKSMP